VHALLHRRLILLPPRADLFGARGAKFHEALAPRLEESGREALASYRRVLQATQGELAGSRRALQALAQSPRWRAPARILMSLPGVGLVTAMTILAELGDYRRFQSRGQVAAYAGLAPIVRDSAEKVGRGPISRRGPALLRWVLVEAAWVAVRTPGLYAQLFAELSRGKPATVAIVAVARRLLVDGWTMLTKGQEFRFDAAKRVRGLRPAPVAVGLAG
jgi:transposase